MVDNKSENSKPGANKGKGKPGANKGKGKSESNKGKGKSESNKGKGKSRASSGKQRTSESLGSASKSDSRTGLAGILDKIKVVTNGVIGSVGKSYDTTISVARNYLNESGKYMAESGKSTRRAYYRLQSKVAEYVNKITNVRALLPGRDDRRYSPKEENEGEDKVIPSQPSGDRGGEIATGYDSSKEANGNGVTSRSSGDEEKVGKKYSGIVGKGRSLFARGKEKE